MLPAVTVWLVSSAVVQVIVALPIVSLRIFRSLELLNEPAGHQSDQSPSWTVAVMFSPEAVVSVTPVAPAPTCPPWAGVPPVSG